MEDMTRTPIEGYSLEELTSIYSTIDQLQAAQQRLERAKNPATRLLARAAVTVRAWQLRDIHSEL